MKSAIRMFVAFVILGSAAGCGQDAKTATILPPDGSTSSSTDSKAAPVTKETDETIAPKAETPPAPTTSPDPTTPPPLPPPAKGPGADEKPPIVIVGKAGLAPVAQALPPPSKPIFFLSLLPRETLALIDLHPVECKKVSGGDCKSGSGEGGSTHEFRCPSNYVVTGFRLGQDEAGFILDAEGSIKPNFVTGGLRIACSHLDMDSVHVEDSAFAEYMETDFETGLLKSFNLAGKKEDAEWGMNCPFENGVANGVFGRSEDHLDSFGLSCGHYFHTDKVTGVLPASYETYTDEAVMYGGVPGIGGSPFDATCDTNEAIVGINIASGDQVDHIVGITCAKVAMVEVK